MEAQLSKAAKRVCEAVAIAFLTTVVSECAARGVEKVFERLPKRKKRKKKSDHAR